MFKQELPLMFPDDPDVKAVRGGHVRPVRVLRRCATKDGLLKTDFEQAAGQGFLPRAVPLARAEHGAEARRRC